MRHIGLLTDTFDPVHAGHLAAAEAAKARGVEEVWLTPAASDHKKGSVSGARRVEMAHLAADGIPGVKVCGRAARHSGTAAETAAWLLARYPDCRFTLIIGADQLPGLLLQPDAGKLFELCGVMCFPHPEAELGRYLPALVRAGARVSVLDTDAKAGCSSVRIRQEIGELRDPTELDPKVLKYIALNGLYLPDRIAPLKKTITEKRLSHTLGVRDTAVELALRWHGPVIKAATAGLLHDCAKSMPVKEARDLVRGRGLEISESEMTGNAMLHGPAGSILAQEKYHVTDPDVIGAIRWHTVGHPGMSLLEKIIFVADMIEPGREDFDGLGAIREAAYTDLDRAMLLCLRTTRDYVLSQGRPFYEVSEKTMRYFESQELSDKK